MAGGPAAGRGTALAGERAAPLAGRVDVMIAIGHPAVREAVQRACAGEDGVRVLGAFGDAEGLLAGCLRYEPGVIVLDAELGGHGALDALRGLRDRNVGAAVLVLSDRTDGASVLEALRLGARGYLGKADGLRGIGRAVTRLAGGERLIDPEMEQAAVMALGEFTRQAREGSRVEAALTHREREILLLISDGMTMRQVARRLGISPRTVETHVAKLYRKLGVRTRVQAVSRAAQLGLIDL